MNKINSELFDTLLGLPLFQGISRGEFIELMGRMRFVRKLFSAGTTIVSQDEPCQTLFFILDGQITALHESDSRKYTLTEWLNPPTVLQPEVLFGLRTRYTGTYKAFTSVRALEIDKAAVRDVLLTYEVFRLNYLNLLSTRLQQKQRDVWRPLPCEASARFFRFLHVRLLRPAGKKELSVKMEVLAEELQVTRLTVSRMLHDLSRKGLIVLRRGRIIIPSFEKLLLYSNV